MEAAAGTVAALAALKTEVKGTPAAVVKSAAMAAAAAARRKVATS